jgi:RNA polymerase sigma factor (TIGR02999 family)
METAVQSEYFSDRIRRASTCRVLPAETQIEKSAAPMTEVPPQTVTQWLLKWHGGDESALNDLSELVYKDLHRLALNYLRRERTDHTLQATALVHEAYLQLHDLQHLDWKNRAHFIGVVAQVMRHVLVDHARERAAQKRGGDAIKLPITRAERIAAESQVDLVELNDALDRLAAESPRKAKVVELHYFGGLSAKEIAEVLSVDGESIAQRTVENDLKIARAKLHGWMAS